MGRPQRFKRDSLKKREMDETMKLLNRSLINKPPTKALLRSARALKKVQLEEAKKGKAGGAAAAITGQTARAAINADVPSTSTMFIPTAAASADGPCSSASMSGTPRPPQPMMNMRDGENMPINFGSSVPLNIESVVERNRREVRAQCGDKEASTAPFMMDPIAILKNPKKMLATPFHFGLPLPGFVKKSCSMCKHMIRDYIVAKVTEENGEELPEEPGYATFYTSQMCSNPDCMDEPKTVTKRKMPKHLYKAGSTICDDSMLLTDEETASALKYVDKVDGQYIVRPHPNPDRNVVMRLVAQYQASGRQKLQIPRLAPSDAHGSDRYLDQMIKGYQFREAKKKATNTGIQREDSDDNDDDL